VQRLFRRSGTAESFESFDAQLDKPRAQSLAFESSVGPARAGPTRVVEGRPKPALQA